MKPFIPLLSLGLLSACATGILRVDQDQYNSGSSLDSFQTSAIRGTPSTDRFGIIVAPAFVTDNTPGGLGRAVSIGERIEFVSGAHPVPDRYQVVWTGARNTVQSDVTNIILRDDAGDEAIRIRYTLNEIDVIWGDDVGLAPLTLNVSNPQEIRIVLHMTGATASADVTISQNDEVIWQRNNLELIDSDFSSLDVVEVRTQTDYYMKDLIAITLED